MFQARAAFSGFSVDDLAKAKAFYTEMLDLQVDQDEMGLHLRLPNGVSIFVYQKPNHQPATFTILNFVVANIDSAMAELKSKGVEFEIYTDPNMPQQDENGVLRGIAANMGPDIAWFKDPAGNVLSVLQEN